jgi:hypothetical protein
MFPVLLHPSSLRSLLPWCSLAMLSISSDTKGCISGNGYYLASQVVITTEYTDSSGEVARFIERILMHYSPYLFGLFLARIFCLVPSLPSSSPE